VCVRVCRARDEHLFDARNPRNTISYIRFVFRRNTSFPATGADVHVYLFFKDMFLPFSSSSNVIVLLS